MDFKTYQQYKETALAKAAVNLPQVDATTDPVLLTMVEAAAAAAFSLQGAVVDLLEESFPQTASGAFLRDVWGAYEGLMPLAATPSIGYITVNTADTIPIGSKFTISGKTFTTQETPVDVSGTRYVKFTQESGETQVTATTYIDDSRTTERPHYLGTGNTIDITASTHPYSGEYTITVVDANTFVFDAATTTAVADVAGEYVVTDCQYVKVKCDTTGEVTNIPTGTLTSASTSISGNAYIAYGGLSGGTEVETDESYRQRILLSRSLVEGDFTNGQIILAALSINGNTRVFIVNPLLTGTGQPDATGTYDATIVDSDGSVTVTTTTPHYLKAGTEITVADTADYAGTQTVLAVVDSTSFTLDTTDLVIGTETTTYTYTNDQFEAANKSSYPIPGVVYVFVLRDNDASIAPSEALLTLTKNAIIENGKLPSHTPQENLVVFAPTLSYLSFEITGLDPDTETMRAAIGTQLAAFFEDSATLSTKVSVDAVRAAIWDTQDLVTNSRVRQFNITAYGQNDGTPELPETAITGVSSFSISQGSIAVFDPNDANSLVFEDEA